MEPETTVFGRYDDVRQILGHPVERHKNAPETVRKGKDLQFLAFPVKEDLAELQRVQPLLSPVGQEERQRPERQSERRGDPSGDPRPYQKPPFMA